MFASFKIFVCSLIVYGFSLIESNAFSNVLFILVFALQVQLSIFIDFKDPIVNKLYFVMKSDY